MLRALAAGLAAAALFGASGAAAAAPRRVVSINLCADQFVMRLADPRAILSVSFVAADPTVSVAPDLARRFRLNRGAIEEVAALRPDLVVSMAGRPDRARFLLDRLGIPFYEMPIPQSLAELRATIRALAGRLGRPERGAAMVAAIDAELAAIDGAGATAAAPHGRALFYGPNGYTFGPDTLIGELLGRAGWANAATQWGIRSYGEIPLERVLAAPPDFLILMDAQGMSQAQRMLRHPALARAMDGREGRFPQSLLLCPGPWTVQAVRQRLMPRPGPAATP